MMKLLYFDASCCSHYNMLQRKAINSSETAWNLYYFYSQGSLASTSNVTRNFLLAYRHRRHQFITNAKLGSSNFLARYLLRKEVINLGHNTVLCCVFLVESRLSDYVTTINKPKHNYDSLYYPRMASHSKSSNYRGTIRLLPTLVPRESRYKILCEMFREKMTSIEPNFTDN